MNAQVSGTEKRSHLLGRFHGMTKHLTLLVLAAEALAARELRALVPRADAIVNGGMDESAGLSRSVASRADIR
jgi:hypothetical protein